MEERLTKIADASFRKAMAKFSSWGDIGIALKNVQSEMLANFYLHPMIYLDFYRHSHLNNHQFLPR